MSKTEQCKNCGRKFKHITKERLCVFCYKEAYKTWSPEFISKEGK